MREFFLKYDGNKPDIKTEGKGTSEDTGTTISEEDKKIIKQILDRETLEYEKFTDCVSHIICQMLDLPTTDLEVYQAYISKDLEKNPNFIEEFFEEKVKEMRKEGILKQKV